MKQKELTKTIMMILQFKKNVGSSGLVQTYVSTVRVKLYRYMFVENCSVLLTLLTHMNPGNMITYFLYQMQF